MTMVATTYETLNDYPENMIIGILVENKKQLVLTTVKQEPDDSPILENGECITDVIFYNSSTFYWRSLFNKR